MAVFPRKTGHNDDVSSWPFSVAPVVRLRVRYGRSCCRAGYVVGETPRACRIRKKMSEQAVRNVAARVAAAEAVGAAAAAAVALAFGLEAAGAAPEETTQIAGNGIHPRDNGSTSAINGKSRRLRQASAGCHSTTAVRGKGNRGQPATRLFERGRHQHTLLRARVFAQSN